jgi:hypothetical protein
MHQVIGGDRTGDGDLHVGPRGWGTGGCYDRSLPAGEKKQAAP